jgi:hypothetical protein
VPEYSMVLVSAALNAAAAPCRVPAFDPQAIVVKAATNPTAKAIHVRMSFLTSVKGDRRKKARR